MHANLPGSVSPNELKTSITFHDHFDSVCEAMITNDIWDSGAVPGWVQGVRTPPWSKEEKKEKKGKEKRKKKKEKMCNCTNDKRFVGLKSIKLVEGGGRISY